jgi:molybdopterin-binding protein
MGREVPANDEQAANGAVAPATRSPWSAHNGRIIHPTEIIVPIQSINARNQFRGRIREIIDGPVVSEVDVETEHGIVTSVITSRSVKELQLQVGTEVLALVKATEVSIAKL